MTEIERLRNEDSCPNRLHNAWKKSAATRQLANDQAVLETLSALYGRKAFPFQTLNFETGSEQRVHCDSMHFSSFPPRFMCAVWIALEDVDSENGPLVYYPGSHREPEYQLDDSRVDNTLSAPNLDDYEAYPEFLKTQLEHRGYKPVELHLRKGDAMIWSSNLAHGGVVIADPARTRRSQITHYYFDNCVYYTPRLSQPYIGRFWLRRVIDVATGSVVPHRFRDQQFSIAAPGLFAFGRNGKPKPVHDRLQYFNARLRAIARDVIKPS